MSELAVARGKSGGGHATVCPCPTSRPQVAIDSEEAATVTARNEEYARLLAEKEPTKFSERSAQTFNNPHKNKETQFARSESTKVGVGVTAWDIFDTMRRLEDEDDDSEPGEPNQEKAGEDGEDAGEMDDETNAILDAMGGDDGEGEGGERKAKQKRNTWMLSANLGHALMIVERMVCRATRGRPAVRGKGTYGGRPGQRVEEQGTWASRTRKHSEAGYGRPGDRGAWTAKTVKRPPQQPTQPPIRQLLGAADAQRAHPTTSRTAPTHRQLGSANAETTPAGAPAAVADRTQRPDATCEGENG